MNTQQANKVRSLIIEDEIFDRNLIEKILRSNYSNYVEIVGIASTVDEAVHSIQQLNPQLLFLDIELNGYRDGAFNILNQVKHNFKIIFVTAKSEQDDLLKAIKLSCIDYLVKPTKISDFEKPIQKVFDELNGGIEVYPHQIELFKHNALIRSPMEAKISLQEGFTYRPTYIKDIVRCEAEGNYARFFLTDRSNLLINGNLKSFEERLSDYGFCRINKSDLINLMHIKKFSRQNTNWELAMQDTKTLIISVQRKQNFLMRYNKFHVK